MNPVTLADGTVRLRPHRRADVDDAVRMCHDPDMVRWTTIPQPFERRHAQDFMLHTVPDGWRSGALAGWAIEADGRYCGNLDLRLDDARGADVGFALAPWARGRGIMTAALRLGLRWAFDDLGVRAAHWKAHVGNWASRRVAWRLGFRVEGTLRSYLTIRGERRDAWVASLLAADPMEPANPWYAARPLAGPLARLRPWREQDAPRVVEGCSDPLTRHWLMHLPAPYTPADATAYLLQRQEAHAAGSGVGWCLSDDGDRCQGALSLFDVNPRRAEAAVGYWLHPEGRGRGLMTNALRLATGHAFAPGEAGGLGLRRLVLYAGAGNAASRGVAARAGFAQTGLAPAAEPLGDGTFDGQVAFHRLASDDPGRS